MLQGNDSFQGISFKLLLAYFSYYIYRGLPSSHHFRKGNQGSTLLMFCPEDIKYELEELSVEDRIHLRNILREIVSLRNDVFAYRANFALFFTFVLPRSYENLEPCCLFCINLRFLVLFCIFFTYARRKLFLFVRLLFQKKADDLEFIGSTTLSRSPLAPSSSSRSSTPNTVYLRSDSDVSCDISSAEKSSDELSDSNTESNNKQMRATIPKIGSYKPALDLPSGFELRKQFAG